MENYKNTYRTIETIFSEFNKKGKTTPYMVGGISAAIQANINLYRQNEDIDLMVDKQQLDRVIECLKNVGYTVTDRRGVLTENRVNKDGVFIPLSHELDCDTTDTSKLGIGIFVYERNNGQVITNSYAFHEADGCVIGTQTVMPEELFDLMYSPEEIEYKGMTVRCQTKEYTYLSKSQGDREKDKIDARVIEGYIGEEEQKRIQRIQVLQKRVEKYRIEYDRDGNIQRSAKYPNIEEKVESFIQSLTSGKEYMSSDELKQVVLSDERVQRFIEQDRDMKEIMAIWENTKSNENLAGLARRITHEYIYTDHQEVRTIRMNQLARNALEQGITETEISTADRVVHQPAKDNQKEGVSLDE